MNHQMQSLSPSAQWEPIAYTPTLHRQGNVRSKVATSRPNDPAPGYEHPAIAQQNLHHQRNVSTTPK